MTGPKYVATILNTRSLTSRVGVLFVFAPLVVNVVIKITSDTHVMAMTFYYNIHVRAVEYVAVWTHLSSSVFAQMIIREFVIGHKNTIG